MPNNETLENVRFTLRSHLRSKTITSCSRWAQERRIIPHKVTNEPLPYSFEFYPWAKEPHDSQAPMNVSMKAAQMGLTEVGINRAFYILDVLKRDVLYVLPTQLNATDFSKSRFGPALHHSRYLKDMFTDTNTVALKRAGAVTLYIRGSRGDSNLKSIPVSELVLDEVDEMDQDQIWLAFKRLSGQMVHKNIWCISTPTMPNHGIHKLYIPSTQEHFFFKCPRCGRQTEFVWPDCFEVAGETITDPKNAESFFRCLECKKPIKHEEKPDFLPQGKWQATNDNSDPDYRGFYVNQLYSYTVKPKEIAVDFHRGMGDEGAMSEFWKSVVGMPYVPEGGQVHDGQLDEAVRGYTKSSDRPVFGHERCITFGIDQGDWLHCEVVEWFVDQFGPDINKCATAKVVWEGKFNVHADDGWDRAAELMKEWQVLHCCVDADPNTNDARQFARRFPGYVTLVRYRRGIPVREIVLNETDDMRTPIATVDKCSWMDISLGRFKVDRIVLPRDISVEYRDHIKAPVRSYRKDKETGNYVAEYAAMGPDHFAAARTYSEIALPFAASYVQGQDISRFL